MGHLLDLRTCGWNLRAFLTSLKSGGGGVGARFR